MLIQAIRGFGHDPLSWKRARMGMVGGQRLDGKRLIWWNFVATSRERIKVAKLAWAREQFPRIPFPAGSLADELVKFSSN
jgi:hypothetical protein